MNKELTLTAVTRELALTAVTRELARYKFDLVGVQEVRWDKGGTVRAGDYNFFYGKGNENHQLGTPSRSNVDNLNNVRRDASRHFRNKKKAYLKAKIEDLETNSKINNIRDLYRGINDFKKG